MINNIILVVCDALRRNNLGCYGYKRDTSPNIDRFASKSIVYENAFTLSNKTDSAFTTIETGLYPHNHHIVKHGGEIKRKDEEFAYNLPTIAKILNDWDTRGYDFLDRWHKEGFKYYMGTERKWIMGVIDSLRDFLNIQPGTWLQEKLEKTPLYNGLLNLLFRQKPPYTVASKLIGKVLEDRYTKYYKTFYFIHFWDTHIPYLPPKEYIRKDKYEGGELLLFEIRKNIHAPLRRFFFDKMMAQYKDANDVMNAYDGEIRFIDDNFRLLLNSMDLDKSLIIFTADHGEVMLENPESYFTHDSFDSCVMNIPMILYYPGCKPQRNTKEVSLCDIAPTILESVGKKIKLRSPS